MKQSSTAHRSAAPSPAQEVSARDQAGKLLGHAAGFVGTRTIEMGLRHGLIATLAQHPDGLSAEELADVLDFDPFYVQVWCRAALASEIVERDATEAYQLAPHVGALLLNEESPAYIGALFSVMTAPDTFDQFAERIPTGQRTWWDQCSRNFIQSVSGTGRPFYTRLTASGFEQVPGLTEHLRGGGRILELACGAGVGLVKAAEMFPHASVVGWDGDHYSLQLAGDRVEQAGISDRTSLVQSSLEELDRTEEFDLVYINISMHECRDIEEVTARVKNALKPDGYFVISDLPFPETLEGLRSTPGRVMSGIQFFEAQIDDQLLPTRDYVELLERHDYRDVDAFDLTPVHVVIHGRR